MPSSTAPVTALTPSAVPPVDESFLDAATILATIPVEREHRGGYDRDLFAVWSDLDQDGCDTRDEVRQALVGEDTGLAYRLGDPVEVRLVEAIPTAGALRFEMLSEGRAIGARPKGAGRPSDKRGPRGYKGKPRTPKHGRSRKRR